MLPSSVLHGRVAVAYDLLRPKTVSGHKALSFPGLPRRGYGVGVGAVGLMGVVERVVVAVHPVLVELGHQPLRWRFTDDGLEVDGLRLLSQEEVVALVPQMLSLLALYAFEELLQVFLDLQTLLLVRCLLKGLGQLLLALHEFLDLRGQGWVEDRMVGAGLRTLARGRGRVKVPLGLVLLLGAVELGVLLLRDRHHVENALVARVDGRRGVRQLLDLALQDLFLQLFEAESLELSKLNQRALVLTFGLHDSLGGLLGRLGMLL